ncbi:hypothetical protein [Streptomyces sp. WAC04114]|uniref:hypothetical protein n=1 Tax=Streptomyces sp. WAC04114 TaxID=2867961 RepID=UPI001C8BC222|nr:hypothetical protein [Streptomyces sp. WAC04114]MBX9363978.1 hypothetical protein [Streptomyces sp. WAC04114]
MTDEKSGERHLLRMTVIMTVITAIAGLVGAVIGNLAGVSGVVKGWMGEGPPTAVTYYVYYTNTGKTDEKSLHVKVHLPNGVEYIKGSTDYWDGDDWVKWEDDNIVTSGLPLKGVKESYLRLTVDVSHNKDGVCGPSNVSVLLVGDVVPTSKKKQGTGTTQLELYAQCS